MSEKVDYTKHKDKRKNNPPIEGRDFMVAEEIKPYPARYPRDPSLDPQLIWRSKDEQDSEDLVVPTVPIYIQEKIHPRDLIEDIRAAHPAADSDNDQPALFVADHDFNGDSTNDDLARLTEFYKHEKHWTNRMILGDSLLVMNSLAEKEGMKGKVQCIYLDPPYGIKFGSNWQVSTRKRQVGDKASDATREPEQVRAFRDTWKLGIHSYLSYLRDRLVIARELLTETGSVFVQIGDENVHLVRNLLDAVFGSENFCALIPFYKTTSQTSELLGATVDYLIWYAKDARLVKFRQPLKEKSIESDNAGVYNWLEEHDGNRRRLTSEEKTKAIEGRIFRLDNMTSQSGGETTSFAYTLNGVVLTPGNGFWKTNKIGIDRLVTARRVVQSGKTLAYVRFIDDFPASPIANLWLDTGTGSFTESKTYVVQTTVKVIQRCILMTTDPGDLVLDPTCGSGTTAYVAEQWGRRWITCDTSRVALALARTRLMTARFPYFLLSDSPEGASKEAELQGSAIDWVNAPGTSYGMDVKQGFVYHRVPHVTLKSIANNPDIRPGMTRHEIDEAIARHADVELLYDKPYEDKKKLRVTGPFTVESLSPHRILNVDEQDQPESEAEAKRDDPNADFVGMVLDNLRKAGVQNTKKGERLKFETLEPYAGRWLHAKGSFLTAEGESKSVAISVGPEYVAVSPMQVKEAAKEAMRGIGHDILVVCGYNFDPHVNEEAKQMGNLTVLPARMNADLAMADELLKKTGSGNLFMVFGEPDLDVTSVALSDGSPGVKVEIRGLDIYDPTTGQIRSNSTDDIACWFIDTDYNGESFFVRHAYFTGADEPYEKLKKALRTEIDEEAWSLLYSTVSRPFAVPTNGRIAVKVINHYGDEVLRVYDIDGTN